VLAESQDEEQIFARVAALDIGKAELVCCVRVPAAGGSGKRLQEVSTHSTMTRSLTELANHLVELRVERVVMEATSDYWKPVFYLLEAHGLEPWLVNARDVKHLPGRPKTDLCSTRSGCARSPNARCYARVSFRRGRSGGYGT
jgi:transposase